MSDMLAILSGLPWTMALTAVALALGVFFGVPLALARRSRHAAVWLAAAAVIALIRSIPPLVWLFILFFGLGTGYIQISPFLAAAVAFGLIATANMAEIYRGGLMAIQHGQWDAAEALGLSRFHTFADVVAPQALRVSLPSAASYAIGLLKDTATASTIGVMELTFQANQLSQRTFSGLYAFGIAAAIYILISLPVAWLARSADSYLRTKVAR
ncbi:amino acid ABC transporter permease [Labrys monachus]|uniref:Polar amino acid transport system permease protein n=1 Tax=Labrys monachus TaxID=217067 RepID=A0ABU0FBN4_9HYPH|nr:amino acid ABC transporter permease [Labrys monachus]MDQ0392022.1 polar amino acid transport system permease protein [Labrys monachus]